MIKRLSIDCSWNRPTCRRIRVQKGTERNQRAEKHEICRAHNPLHRKRFETSQAASYCWYKYKVAVTGCRQSGQTSDVYFFTTLIQQSEHSSSSCILAVFDSDQKCLCSTENIRTYTLMQY